MTLHKQKSWYLKKIKFTKMTFRNFCLNGENVRKLHHILIKILSFRILHFARFCHEKMLQTLIREQLPVIDVTINVNNHSGDHVIVNIN